MERGAAGAVCNPRADDIDIQRNLKPGNLGIGGKVKKEQANILSVIDVGTSKTLTAIGEVDSSGDLNIIGLGSAPNEGMKKGLVVDLESVTGAVYESVGEAEKMADRVIEGALVSISGSHITANSSRGSAPVLDPHGGVTGDDIRKAIEASRYLMLPPEKQIIDIIEQEFTLDGQAGIKDPLGMSGSNLEVNVQIITGSTSFVSNLTKCILKLEIPIDGLMLGGLASGEAVLNRDEKQVGIVLLDIGAGTTDVTVFKDGYMLNSWVIPVGGNHIDNDIAVYFGTSRAEAERLKIEHGRAYLEGPDDGDPIEIDHVGGEDTTQVPRGMLCQVIQPRVAELLKIIRDDMENNLPPTVLPAGIVITGGTSLLDGLPEMAEEILGLKARIARPKYNGPFHEKVLNPFSSTAFGMLSWAAKHSVRAGYSASPPSDSIVHNVVNTISKFFKGFSK